MPLEPLVVECENIVWLIQNSIPEIIFITITQLKFKGKIAYNNLHCEQKKKTNNLNGILDGFLTLS